MAYIDYQHCAICDTKAFYDVGVDWESQRAAEVMTLCSECAKTHTMVVVRRDDSTVEPKVNKDWAPWVNDVRPVGKSG